jgi:hypothetical protein
MGIIKIDIKIEYKNPATCQAFFLQGCNIFNLNRFYKPVNNRKDMPFVGLFHFFNLVKAFKHLGVFQNIFFISFLLRANS